jgi:hypothetical protein
MREGKDTPVQRKGDVSSTPFYTRGNKGRARRILRGGSITVPLSRLRVQCSGCGLA